jgi:hypothetical protein
MSEGFEIDGWTGMLFFRFCRLYRINKREDRVLVLRELARRKKAKYIRDVRPLMADKKVLKIGFKQDHNFGPEHWCNDCKPKGD